MGAISPEFQYVDTYFCPLYLEVSFSGCNIFFFLEYFKNVTPFFFRGKASLPESPSTV